MRVFRHTTCFLFLITLSLGLIPLTALASQAAEALSGAIGQVVSLSGTVTAMQPDGALRVLDLNHEVAARDTIVTGSKSAVEILFQDESVFSQGPDSSTTLDDFVYANEPSASKMLLKMGTGTFRYVTGQIVKQNPDGFALQTPTATIGIRGTEVFAETVEQGEEIGVLSMTPGHVVEVSTPQARQSMARPGLSVMASRDGRLSDPSPTSPETRSRVINAAPQTSQGEPGPTPQTRQDLDRMVEAFKAAVDRTKGELGGLGQRPDYGRLHHISLQRTGLQKSESNRRTSSITSNTGLTGNDSDSDGGGEQDGW